MLKILTHKRETCRQWRLSTRNVLIYEISELTYGLLSLMSPGMLLQAKISVSYLGQGLENLHAHKLSSSTERHTCGGTLDSHACGDLSAAGVEIKD